jgi:NADPH:quinone reductase-like Zn-dependent oxidoreductase
MKYKKIVMPRRGGIDVLKVTQDTLSDLSSGQVCVKVLYAGVSFADVLIREGVYLGMPKFPLTPGYDLVGVVEQTGSLVSSVSKGQRVAALTVTGSYSEYMVLPERELTGIPEDINLPEAVCLILNYMTAYQMLHRTANVQSGQTVLIHGASGGVGTALLQLGALAQLTMYGTASKSKHTLVKNLGGIPIDYKKENFVRRVKTLTHNQGVDAVFDGTGSQLNRSYSVLKKKGKLILYGISSMLVKGRYSLIRRIFTFLRFSIFLRNLVPDTKNVALYRITAYKKKSPDLFQKDLAYLFALLKDKKISPVIARILPLEKAALAHELLNNSAVSGKIILGCKP